MRTIFKSPDSTYVSPETPLVLVVFVVVAEALFPLVLRIAAERAILDKINVRVCCRNVVLTILRTVKGNGSFSAYRQS